MLIFKIKFLLLVLTFISAAAAPCLADAGNRPSASENAVMQAPRGRLLKGAAGSLPFFKAGYSVSDFFGANVIEVSDENAAVEPSAPAAVPPAAAQSVPVTAPAVTAPVNTPPEKQTAVQPGAAAAGVNGPEKKGGPRFVEDFKPEHLQSPDEDPKIRINKDAPPAFIGLATAHQDGDDELADRFADQLVRYQQNFIFEVRQLTQIIGRALIRQKVIKDDDWGGVQQYIDFEMAKTREEKGDLFRPTHERAMERIKADPKGRADVYFFFALNCSYCRFMAPDVQRLWQVLKADPSVKMTAVSMGAIPEGWIEDYRSYTGATFPIFDGQDIARALHIRFVPAIVVMSPNTKNVYVKSGQQSFTRMYEFVRRVQGLPASLTPEIQGLIDTPIGELEKAKVKKGEWKLARLSAPDSDRLKPAAVSIPKKRSTDPIERF